MFIFQLCINKTAEWFRNQRLNWADSRPCCEPQFWEPHILVIEMKEVYSGALIKLIMHLTPLNLWTRSMAKSAFKDVCMRSLQCPPNSCRNPVIPAESSGFQRNEVWQEGLLFSSFWCLIIPAEFGHSGLTPECSAECAGTECNRIQLFICSSYVCWSYMTLSKNESQVKSSGHSAGAQLYHNNTNWQLSYSFEGYPNGPNACTCYCIICGTNAIMTLKGEGWAHWSSRVYMVCISLKIIVGPNTQIQWCDPGV